MKHNRGFTLIELLVVIAIIALLLAIVLPSLRMAKEQSRRMICASNLKSIGTGLVLYAEAYDNKAIPNCWMDGTEIYSMDNTWQPWFSYIVGVDHPDWHDWAKPVQLGKLYSESFVDVPDVYYCPTAQVNKLRDEYVMAWYVQADLAKILPPGTSHWGIPRADNRCRANYMYYTWQRHTYLDLSTKPVVVDRLSSSDGLAHKKNGQPFGINALFGDGHVNMTRVDSKPELAQLARMGYSDMGQSHANFVTILRLLEP